MAKPITPYHRLLDSFRAYASKVEFRKRRLMWRYPKGRLDEGWALSSLAERVSAAEQLGYDVRLRVDDQGLVVEYIQKIPGRPFEVS